MKTHLIYHRKDADGILSAAIVCHALNLTPDNSSLYGVDHPEPCPLLDYRSTKGTQLDRSKVEGEDRIVIVDFSFPSVELVTIPQLAERVTLYDHHSTALDEFDSLLPLLPHWVIDPTRAACQIVWDELVGTERPWWLELIGWRDLGGPWQPGADPDKSHEANTLNTGLFSFAPLDPYALAQSIRIESDWQRWFDDAETLCAANQSAARAIAQAVPFQQVHFKDHAEPLPVIFNVHPAQQSDVCHWLMKIHHRDAACVCNRSSEAPYDFTFSFRSNANGPDVAALAKRYGGGGHRHAAGCTLPYLPLLSYS
jgi:uncharacterized protein